MADPDAAAHSHGELLSFQGDAPVATHTDRDGSRADCATVAIPDRREGQRMYLDRSLSPAMAPTVSRT
jgi:hypothetical protein